jgi:MoaA/NifB/PqqE/SkfB family radical SAM enzyme
VAHYAYLDLCFFEKCNLTCNYCRVTNEGMVGDASLETMRGAVRSFLDHSMAAIFKLSGYGEVSLWPHLGELLGEFSARFPVAQVITNGTMPLARAAPLLEIPNVVFCVTIDGHEVAANAHRTKGKVRLHDKMFRFVRRVLEAGRGIELNCVLTAANIDQFPDYLAFVRDELPGAVVMPFPVRPFVGLATSPRSAEREQVERAFGRILSQYQDYAAVLPSRAYAERLRDFMLGGQRAWSCLVPALNYGVGPGLSPLACACLGHTKPSDDLFNLVVPEAERSATNRLVDVSALRPGRISKGYVDERCRTCFTHYEVLNLFLEGQVPWEDIERIPSFGLPKARSVLELVRAELDLSRRAVGAPVSWGQSRLQVVS